MEFDVNKAIRTDDWFQVFRQTDIALIITDCQGKIVFCNHKYVETCKYDTLGVEAEQIVGMNMRELLNMGNIEHRQSAVLLALERKQKVQAIFEAPLYKLVMSTAIPALDENGMVKFVFTTVQDESEIFRLTTISDEVRKLYYEYMEKSRRNSKNRVIAVSKPMRQIMDKCLQVSGSDLSILLLGESSVGKDVIAHFIHENSVRRNKPLVALNCGAIPENLIESELFGYVPGAFTGASRSGKAGLFEAANNGTIMLDEIGDLSLPMQVKLLRVLENRQVTRIGSVHPIHVDFRLISATNKNLMEKVQCGEFRKDLYYRINAFRVMIPPLRDRQEDISAPATHYLALYNLKYKFNHNLTSEAVQELSYYKWPGNIRELRNIMEQLVVLSSTGEIQADLVRRILYSEDTAGGDEPAVIVKHLVPLRDAVSLTERKILELVKEKETSSYKAARLLQVDQTTVLYKLKKYGISGFRD